MQDDDEWVRRMDLIAWRVDERLQVQNAAQKHELWIELDEFKSYLLMALFLLALVNIAAIACAALYLRGAM
jgi:hypothetical protein